jgi:hypothetical protein
MRTFTRLAMVTTVCGILASGALAHARSPYEGVGQVEDGEAGYKIGCSVASSLGIPSCGELPSGQQFMPAEQYGPPAPAPEQYGPPQEPEPAPGPAPQEEPAPSGSQDSGEAE